MRFQNFKETNIAYWSKRAPGYSEVNKEELASRQRHVWRKVITEAIEEHFGNRRPEELYILDVGIGPGFFAILMAELGYQVTAVDYTTSMLQEAKHNAGDLAGKICFLEMNAEELAFPEKSFDVILSRNLTWNLHDPERAYRNWNRVLKPGGLLLNFDANWYHYLHDEEARQAHFHDRENVKITGESDDTAGTDVAAMEAIAYQAPLSAVCRPEWDERLLGGMGMDVTVDRHIWRQVWTKQEWINNASTPMFLVRGVKKAG